VSILGIVKRMNAVALMVTFAAAFVSSAGCSSPSSSASAPAATSVLRGQYQASSPGALDLITFEDATNYSLGTATPCTDGIPGTCFQDSEQGTYALSGANNVLSLTNAATGQTRTFPFQVLAMETSSTQALRPAETHPLGGLTSGDGGTSLVGGGDGGLVAAACASLSKGSSVQLVSDFSAGGQSFHSLSSWELRHGPGGGTPLYHVDAYANLPSVWGINPPPAVGSDAFNAEVFRRYGLFPADFDNDGLPLGVLKATGLLNGRPGLVTACEFCHSISLFGTVHVGVPNPFSNMTRFYQDIAAADGQRPPSYPFEFNPAGNSMVNAADKFGRWGLELRKPTDPKIADITPAIRLFQGLVYELNPAAYLQTELNGIAYLKVAAWFNFGVKQASTGPAAYYADGGEAKDANFSAFTYLLTFKTKLDGTDLRDGLKNFKARAPAYLATLTAPKYPFPVNCDWASRGLPVYNQECASCHGTASMSKDGTNTPILNYPGIIVDVGQVGTDPLRANPQPTYPEKIKSVLRETYGLHRGYVAQPLNGIWARSPYLHNGSVPTLAQLLNSSTRIAKYAMTANPNNVSDYDQVQVGWVVSPAPDTPSDPFLRIYDASKSPGLGNAGHTYGDSLSDTDRKYLLEFLKTL
jgi:hypothetical protein